MKAAVGRHHPQQRGHRQQEQPNHARRIVLMPAQRQRDQRQRRPAPTPQPTGRQRDDQHQKHVIECPARHPGRRCPVGTTDGNQPPAGRQVQVSAQLRKVPVPARGRHPRQLPREARFGHQIDVATPHFDPRTGLLRQTGNELRQTVDADLPQRQPVLRRQPPAGVHLPLNAVAHGQPTTVEIQPKLARQRQPVGLGLRVTATQFSDHEAVSCRTQSVGGQIGPVRWQLHLSRIDLAHPLDVGQAVGRRRGIHPGLRRRPERRLTLRLWHQHRQRRRMTCRYPKCPAPRPKLRPQRTIRFQPCRQRRRHLDRDEAVQQRIAQHQLTRPTRHFYGQMGGDHARMTIGHPPEHLHGHRIFGRTGRGIHRLAQPQAVAAQGQWQHLDAVAHQPQQAGVGRHRQRSGQRLPDKAPAQHMPARLRQRHMRHPVTIDHDGRHAIEGDGFGPVARIAGQGHERGTKHRQDLTKPAAAGLGQDHQFARPDAMSRRRHEVDGAGQLRPPVAHPCHPWGQRRRHGGRRPARADRICRVAGAPDGRGPIGAHIDRKPAFTADSRQHPERAQQHPDQHQHPLH